MNYYIIPKNNFNIKVDVVLTSQKIEPIISYSLMYHTNSIYNQISRLKENHCDEDCILTIDYINKIVNPFEFIYTNVPGSTISVSKVKPDATIFFELMELFQIFEINEILSLKDKINVAHLTHNYTSTTYFLNVLRENNADNVLSNLFDYDCLYDLFIKNTYEYKLDLIIFEFQNDEYNNTKKYIDNMMLVLLILIKYQTKNGVAIIKLDHIVYKAVIDVIFVLSRLYDKIYLVKPVISDVTKSERYLICKGFDETNNSLLSHIEEQLIPFLNDKTQNIYSIIENELPYYLLNKLEESNLVIGQQQLEAYDQIINIFTNKNRDERIENLTRSHIQKCIQWCEKNQLPHNKFIDKINIFLIPKKKLTDEENKTETA